MLVADLGDPVEERLHEPGARVADGVKENPDGPLPPRAERDRERTFLLLDALVGRAALLAAGVIAAAALKSGRGALASRPVCVAVDGTTWREVPGLAARAASILDRNLGAERGRHVRIVLPERATLMGAAVAALAS